MPNPGVEAVLAEERLQTIEKYLDLGHAPRGITPARGEFGALRMAVNEYGKPYGSADGFLRGAESAAGRSVDWSRWKRPVKPVLSAPDGYHVKGTSTYVDEAGRIKGQWIKTDVDKQRQYELQLEAIQSAIQSAQVRKRVKKPTIENEDLMVGIPIGDQHIGMYAWGEETLGADWNTEKGGQMLCDAFGHLVESAPAAGACLIAIMGDYFHYDSMASVTPAHRNQLDTDTRYKQMAETGIDAAIHCVDAALAKFGKVHVILEKGNHDPVGILWMQSLLSRLYKANPRVTIDESPAHFHYFRFGKTLIGTHHGDGKAAKATDLPEIMAHDCAEIWSDTRHRYWWTGHVHNRKQTDFRTCMVESMRVLPPGDSYSATNGYRARRELQAIYFHAEFGEVGRATATPEMLV